MPLCHVASVCWSSLSHSTGKNSQFYFACFRTSGCSSICGSGFEATRERPRKSLTRSLTHSTFEVSQDSRLTHKHLPTALKPLNSEIHGRKTAACSLLLRNAFGLAYSINLALKATRSLFDSASAKQLYWTAAPNCSLARKEASFQIRGAMPFKPFLSASVQLDALKGCLRLYWHTFDTLNLSGFFVYFHLLLLLLVLLIFRSGPVVLSDAHQIRQWVGSCSRPQPWTRVCRSCH